MSIEVGKPLTFMIEEDGLVGTHDERIRALVRGAFAAEGDRLNAETAERVLTNTVASLSAELVADHPTMPLHGRNDLPVAEDMNTVQALLSRTAWWITGSRIPGQTGRIADFVDRPAFDSIIARALDVRIANDPNVTIKRGDEA